MRLGLTGTLSLFFTPVAWSVVWLIVWLGFFNVAAKKFLFGALERWMKMETTKSSRTKKRATQCTTVVCVLWIHKTAQFAFCIQLILGEIIIIEWEHVQSNKKMAMVLFRVEKWNLLLIGCSTFLLHSASGICFLFFFPLIYIKPLFLIFCVAQWLLTGSFSHFIYFHGHSEQLVWYHLPRKLWCNYVMAVDAVPYRRIQQHSAIHADPTHECI